MPSWDSPQYLRFEDARTRPAGDLLARILTPAPVTVVDVGCGPGNSTRLLVDRWPEAQVTGIDSSSSMLDEARAEVPEASFVESDLRLWEPSHPVDVVFANATLQWLDDHPTVLLQLLSWLAPGGVLAVQMPHNYDSPSHVLMRELASSDRWWHRLGGVLREAPVAPAADYFRLLNGHGPVDMWITEYLHALAGADPILEWVKGTGLRPVLDRLDQEEADEFIGAYSVALRRAYPPEEDGTTLFPFRRLFFVVSG